MADSLLGPSSSFYPLYKPLSFSHSNSSFVFPFSSHHFSHYYLKSTILSNSTRFKCTFSSNSSSSSSMASSQTSPSSHSSSSLPSLLVFSGIFFIFLVNYWCSSCEFSLFVMLCITWFNPKICNYMWVFFKSSHCCLNVGIVTWVLWNEDCITHNSLMYLQLTMY